jgi:transcriptional regulator of acetoin/glycerol metabolism
VVRKLYDEGEHTVGQIANIVGCSRATIYRKVKDFGIA